MSHETLNDLDRRAGQQINEIRDSVTAHNAAIDQAIATSGALADRITALEARIKTLTADAGLKGAVKSLEARIYALEGRAAPR